MSAFDQLHPKVQRWIWGQGWESLRDIQERDIPPLLAEERDLIIMAPTAGGKTEAAFLPIVSRILEEPAPAGRGFQAVYVGPLRALINDQFSRMESLCENLEISVTKWHGDVSSSTKNRARKNAEGILLITPESLEALLIRRGREIEGLFHALRYVVIDEMHVFLDTARGRQLQSILHRLCLAAHAAPVRVGLSATLGDVDIACSFLRPAEPDRVDVLPSGPGAANIRLQLRGYIEPARRREGDHAEEGSIDLPSAEQQMVDDLYRVHRNKHSLIFAGARGRVEAITAALEVKAAEAGGPGTFFAHHGNLSRGLREMAEERMKDKAYPASIVCTTTLELGIDVGAIDAVAQLGPGHTVSGMRQRLGRSGRRAGQDAVMRFYLIEEALTESRSAHDQLRVRTVMTIAMINLMLRSWNEPPDQEQLHFSTLMQQILALIGQYGGISYRNLATILLKSRIFPSVTQPLLQALLRHMGREDVGLLTQAADGTLLPGPKGEKLLEGWDIFSVFLPSDDYTISTVNGQTIGKIPRENGFRKGGFLIFAGRYWQVADVYEDRKEVIVQPALGGNAPRFSGSPVPPHEVVLEEMRRLYQSREVPAWLNSTASELLAEGRESFHLFGLQDAGVIRHGEATILLFPWAGPKLYEALRLALLQAGVSVTPLGLMLAVPMKQTFFLRQTLDHLASSAPPDPLALAALMEDKQVEKYDHFLTEELLDYACAHDRLDVGFLPQLAARLLGFLTGESGRAYGLLT